MDDDDANALIESIRITVVPEDKLEEYDELNEDEDDEDDEEEEYEEYDRDRSRKPKEAGKKNMPVPVPVPVPNGKGKGGGPKVSFNEVTSIIILDSIINDYIILTFWHVQ